MREGLAARPRATQGKARPVRRRARRGLAACCAAVTLALAAAACGSGGTASSGPAMPVNGGTVTWAEQPSNWPDFIFPFTPGNQFSVTNINYFQYFMYRPLYWYGTPQSPVLNPGLSLADPPQYKGQTVTIKLKSRYHWSNGESVDAQDVVFWMNMMKAEKENWGGYVQGDIPDNVGAVTVAGPDTVKMTIKGPYTQLWFTDNELSQITPMPAAWDVTSAGPGDCATKISGCAAVYNYLLAQAGQTATYATSKIWSVVDGPWHLKKFAVNGDVVFGYNTNYGGPVTTPHISTFEEVPFTTEQAEYNVLLAGGSQGLDVGYLPTVDAPVPPSGTNVGPNPLTPRYKLAPLYEWGLDYMPYDFKNPTTGPIFSQLYFRQAFQDLVDQEGIISGPLHGYGVVSNGPVGDVPRTKYLSSQALSEGDKYPLNQTEAAKLLAANGWTVRPNQQTTCTSPGTGAGHCGAHIRQGQPLSMTINYDGAISWVASAVKELVSNAADVGITITAQEGTFNSVVGYLGGKCGGFTTTNAACTWDLLDWGGGWSYLPDYLPTGEELFQTGSGANYGGYHNSENDALIKKTLDAPSSASFYDAFHQWENYLAGQLPVVMEPSAPYQLTETASDLHVGTQLSTLMLNPEQWYFVK